MSSRKQSKGRKTTGRPHITLEDHFPHEGFMKAMRAVAELAEGFEDGMLDLTCIDGPGFAPLAQALGQMGYLAFAGDNWGSFDETAVFVEERRRPTARNFGGMGAVMDARLTPKGKRLVAQLIEARRAGGYTLDQPSA